MKIGITGQDGFVGKHLYNTLGLFPDEFQRVEFQRNFFESETDLDSFVLQCDVIVHLAAMNRHESQEVIYETNVNLVEKLIASLERTNSKSHVLISSSSQEEKDNLYGKSKREGRELLVNWAEKNEAVFTGLVIPNVFGPFGKPFYNSVVATFCHQVSHNETPKIDVDGNLKLIYVGELVQEIIKQIQTKNNQPRLEIQHTSEQKVSQILALLEKYKTEYQDKDCIPNLKSTFELNLFNTYRCYMDIANHFHTRKIERFAVIKGKALIQLRKIGTDEVLNFELDGDEPAYVDMPIWYTHNIKNIGDDILYTNFWINEFFNPNDADTYFEVV